MALFLIFAGLASVDMVTIIVQNFAIHASVPSDSDVITQYLNKEK